MPTQTVEVQTSVGPDGREALWIQTFEVIDFDGGSSCRGAINADVDFVP